MIAKMSDAILRLAELYAQDRSLKLSTVSLYAAGQGQLFQRLRGGAGITVRRGELIIQWFSDHWPSDVGWPLDIPRPAPAPDSPAVREAEELAEAARVGNPLRELGEDGKIADPEAFCAAMPVTVLPATFYHVIAQYADGKPRAHKTPRRGSNAYYVLDYLVRAGDSRFVTRVAKRTKEEVMNRRIASKFGLAS